MEIALKTLQVILLGVSIVGGIVAVITYRRDSNRRRAEWLMSFYEKFYEEPRYKKTRYLLDYKPQEYDELKRVVESGEADERAEQIVDYLNFFEFLGSLWRLGQISYNDICMLFQYYLDNIIEQDWLLRFVRKQGFESLDLLIKEMQSRKARARRQAND
jgi:hypothetical protein